MSSTITLLFLTLLLKSISTQHQDQIAFQPNLHEEQLQQDPTSKLASTYTPQDISSQFINHVESLPEKRLIRWPDGRQEWITEGQKALLIFNQGRREFVDVTDWIDPDPLLPQFTFQSDPNHLHPDLVSRPPSNSPASFPHHIRVGKSKSLKFLDQIQTSRMKSRLTKFTSFRTRYYRSKTGRESQAWLHEKICKLVSESKSKVTVSEFEHSWGQHTIIARFEPTTNGTVSAKNNSTFVIGAHQDSTNLIPFFPAPGADDDGSGTMSILEAFTVLLKNDWSPSPNTGALEFMWFSAEEGGLLGSQQVAKFYRDHDCNVSGMVQFDMTAFVKKNTTPSVGLITDFVDPSLTQFLRILIDEYLDIGWTNTKCGYACSDHASWIAINVPSAFAIESSFEDSNQKIHSVGDTIHQPEFSFEHMAEFSKLVLGLVFELKGALEPQ